MKIISASYWLPWTFLISDWSKEAQQGQQFAISDVKIISVSYWSLWPFLISDWSKEARQVAISYQRLLLATLRAFLIS